MVELCQRVEISEDELVEIVGPGVIVPLEPAQPSWEFDYPALSHLQRAGCGPSWIWIGRGSPWR